MAYVCGVCNGIIRYLYMAEDSVWILAGFGTKDYACIPCLKDRLGRELTPDDFSDASCNWIIKGITDPGLRAEIEGRFGVKAFLRFWS